MRKVVVSEVVDAKIEELEKYLQDELKFSKYAAQKRSRKMREFVKMLALPADYGLCRFKPWRALGYRCIAFEKAWIFAYEPFDDGIIIRDMAHGTTLHEAE